jgi:Uma2 family endonuclease
MAILVESEVGSLEVPVWVVDLPSFRRWVQSDDCPERQPVHFVNGHVWVDATMEEFGSHNQVKAEVHSVVRWLVKTEDLGTYLPDGMRYTNDNVGFSTEPDGMFVSHESLESGRVSFESGPRGTATELVGVPDLVIEVVSRSSERKDTDWLATNYFDAGIPEYWLIDARGEAIRFDIFKAGKTGFVASKAVGGWVKSVVLNRSFQLSRGTNRSKVVTYSLQMR